MPKSGNICRNQYPAVAACHRCTLSCRDVALLHVRPALHFHRCHQTVAMQKADIYPVLLDISRVFVLLFTFCFSLPWMMLIKNFITIYRKLGPEPYFVRMWYIISIFIYIYSSFFLGYNYILREKNLFLPLQCIIYNSLYLVFLRESFSSLHLHNWFDFLQCRFYCLAHKKICFYS